MLNRSIKSLRGFVLQKPKQSVMLTASVHHSKSKFITTAHHTLMILGMISIAILGTMIVKPDFADHFKALSPFAETEVDAEAEAQAVIAAVPPLTNLMDTPSKPFTKQMTSLSLDALSMASRTDHPGLAGTQREQKRVTEWIAKRYRVAGDATNMLVSAAYLAAKDTKLDPLLILSVMAIESGFNPFAESPVGAQGLMQVMSKIHHEKFQELGGIKAALNPVANIKVGASILREYVQRGGSVEAGLKMYVGAAAFATDDGYGYKVLAEYHRLKDVAIGKNVSLFSTPAAVVEKPAPAPAVKSEPNAIEAHAITSSPNVSNTTTPEQLAVL